MTKVVLPPPISPHIKPDGLPNSKGYLVIKDQDTGNLVDVFKEDGSVYGSTITLNSKGFPEDGAIFWERIKLYNIEEYDVDDVLLYTTENFRAPAKPNSQIITPTTWVVDGVGSSITTFKTLAAAMDEARRFSIKSGSALTISIEITESIEPRINLTHKDGERIIVRGGLGWPSILKPMSGVTGSFILLDSSVLQEVSNLTISLPKASSLFVALHLSNANLNVVSDFIIEAAYPGSSEAQGLKVENNSVFSGYDLTINNVRKPIECLSKSRIVIGNVDITNYNSASPIHIYCADRSYVQIGGFSCISSGNNDTGVESRNASLVKITQTLTLTNLYNGVNAVQEGIVHLAPTTTMTNVTNRYTYKFVDTINTTHTTPAPNNINLSRIVS